MGFGDGAGCELQFMSVSSARVCRLVPLKIPSSLCPHIGSTTPPPPPCDDAVPRLLLYFFYQHYTTMPPLPTTWRKQPKTKTD